MKVYLVVNREENYNEEFYNLTSAKKAMKEHNAKGYISIFALSGVAKGVSIKGLLYELNDAEITPYFPVGVSNEFIGKESKISVTDGILTIIFEETKDLVK